MKKLYVSLTLALLFTVCKLNAQVTPVNHKLKTVTNSNTGISLLSSQRRIQPANHTASVVWSDDFSNPSNWTMVSQSTSNDNWIIDAVGPIGPFTIGPITSTSAGNGWATFDSDNLCSGDQIGDLTNATPINCIGHPIVNLKFQQFYRRYYDSTYVLVSNDSITWTRFQVNQSLVMNSLTSNPTNVTINISSAAGNQATVWIRFQFWSPASLAGNPGCGYAWEIDDVSIEDAIADDIGMVTAFPSPYAEIPLSLVQPIPLSARINNAGLVTETNVGFNAYVFVIQGGNPILISGPTASNTATSLLPGDTTVTLTAGNYTPPDTGLYMFLYIDFMTNADGNTANDTMLNYIIVDESTYAKDYTDIDGNINTHIGSTTVSLKMGQAFDIFLADTVSSVTFYLGGAHVGDTVTASVYGVSSGLPNFALGTTANHIITTADTSNFVNLSFSPGIAVGTGSFAIVLNQVSTTHNIALGFDNNIYTPNTTFYKAGAGAWALLDTGSFYKGAFVLRPNLGAVSCNLGVTANVTNASCSSCNDGSATAIISNGFAPYTYTWFTAPIQNAQTATSLSPGTYTVCATDGAGCTACNYSITVSSGCTAYYYLYADTNPHSYYLVNMSSGTPPLTYDWNWGDGSPHDTAAFPAHTYAGQGNYTICLSITDATSCTNSYCSAFYLLGPMSSSAVGVQVIPPVTSGVQANSNVKIFSVYPNPTSGDLILRLSENAEVNIYNVLGETKFHSFIKENETHLNLSSLSSGIYFIKVTNENGVRVKRFIKE